jgi:hypothetical protein
MGNGTPEELGEGGPPAPPSLDELHRRFFFHPPRDEQAVAAHRRVSELTHELAVELCTLCPPGRNLSLALTELESVRMRANAAIAVDDPRP